MNWRSTLALAVLSCAFVAVLLPSLSKATTPSASSVRNGPLTVIASAPQNPALDGAIATIDASGAPQFLIRPKGCCELFGLAWSPNGSRLAYSLTCIGCGPQALRTYGLHLINIATGKDVRILPRYDGYDLDWSRDGSMLAFVISKDFPRPSGWIYVTKPDGTGRRRLATGTVGRDTSPSFSPRGTRLAFATLAPSCPHAALCSKQSVSVVDTDGAHRRLIATHATAPAWSPNGRRIAVRSLGGCRGIRLLTPAGRDVTPGSPSSSCRVIGVAGTPIWSPDGRQIAIQTTQGIYVMNANGTGLKVATTQTGAGEFGFTNPARPAWRPD
jgi:Tol biopolymer transport system component